MFLLFQFLKRNMELENEGNINEKKRLKGKKLLYGQIVQLRHLFTNKYIHMSTKNTSITEPSSMSISLVSHVAKQSHFRILPKYKIKSEGDIVQVNDQVVFESIKTAGQYLHYGKQFFTNPSPYRSVAYEMNLSVQPSGFCISLFSKPPKHDDFLKV